MNKESEYQTQMRQAATRKHDKIEYGAQSFNEIMSGESQLTTAMRVPDLITGSAEKYNREVFRDCQ